MEGLQQLHQIGIIHLDLKLNNIVLNEDIVKIVDYGTSRILKKDGGYWRTSNPGGHSHYFSPEQTRISRVLISDERLTDKCDIFAAGLILCELILNEKYDGKTSKIDLVNRVKDKIDNSDLIPDFIPDMLEDIFSVIPEIRPNAEIILSSLQNNSYTKRDVPQLYTHKYCSVNFNRKLSGMVVIWGSLSLIFYDPIVKRYF
eukprot:TRINITY_DN609_c0_g1_i1.p1 TRINITY_DN609_c0_g1~~TRINITY_DN609_c0_g1_i1.p1  ORF type:complete len:201 (-),score=19.94 TRINITY_DN609_c0_g1_i1:278-880(-)